MSSTSQPTTFSDLYTDLGQRLRVTTSVAATLEQLKRYINISLMDIHLGFDYKLPWCEAQSYIRTKPTYSTGTVSGSLSSVTLTGTGTAWNTANSYGQTNVTALGKMVIEGVAGIQRVATVTNDTSLTLYTAPAAESAPTDATYVYYEDEYVLSSTFLRPIDFTSFSPDFNIPLISRADFRRRYPKPVMGKPRVACLIESTTSASNLTPVRKVMFHPYPDQVYLIPYSYVTSTICVSSSGTPSTTLTADSDVPTMPLRYRHAIVYHALYHWYRDKKDDARAEMAKAEYTDIMMRIVGDHDIATHTEVRLKPQVGSYVGAAKTPYSYRGGRKVYDLNDEWDSFRR